MTDLTQFLLKDQDISDPIELKKYIELLKQVIDIFQSDTTCKTVLLEKFDTDKDNYIPELVTFDEDIQSWISIFELLFLKKINSQQLMQKGVKILESFISSSRPFKQQIILVCIKLIHKSTFNSPFISVQQFLEEVKCLGNIPESISKEKIISRKYTLLIKLLLKWRQNQDNSVLLQKRLKEYNIVISQPINILKDLMLFYKQDESAIKQYFTQTPEKFILSDYYGFHVATVEIAQIKPITQPQEKIPEQAKIHNKINTSDIEQIDLTEIPDVIDFEDLSVMDESEQEEDTNNEGTEQQYKEQEQSILPNLPTIIIDDEISITTRDQKELPHFDSIEQFLTKIKMPLIEFENLLYEVDLILSINNQKLSTLIQLNLTNTYIYTPDNVFYKKYNEIPKSLEEITYYLNNNNSILPQLASLLPLRTTLLNFITTSFSQKLYLQNLNFNQFFRQFFDINLMQNLSIYRKSIDVQDCDVSLISTELDAEILVRLAQFYQFVHGEKVSCTEILVKICQFVRAQTKHFVYEKYVGSIFKMPENVSQYTNLESFGLTGEKFALVKSAFQVIQIGLQIQGLKSVIDDILEDQAEQ